MTEKKKTPGKAKTRSETKSPVVKEIKVSEVKANEEEDKRLIVVIAIAILIIIGTVIGLLVGCQKEEENNSEENNTTDIITVPVTDNKVDEEEPEEYDVVKTTSSTTTTKYQITYILDGKKVYSTNIASGKKISKYTPSGYENCSYYGDNELSEKFDFSKVPEDDTKVYLVCTLKEYTVTYKDSDGSEISSVTLKGTDTEGYKVEGNSKDNFLGWSKNASKTVAYKAGAKINVNQNLTLTAVYGETTVVYKSIIVHRLNQEMDVDYGNETEEPPVEDVVVEEIPEEIPEEDSGYSSNVVVVDSVEIGYTQEEIDNYTLPSDPSEVGLETPTYFVPVDEETDTSKRIVSDDEEELTERQIRLGDVEGRTPNWYTPAVDDNVEEKDCEFQGWSEPSDYKPDPSGGNQVDAIYTIPEEDEEPPKQESSNNNTESNPPVEQPAAEEVVSE